MNHSFGQFLVERKLISSEVFLDCLLEQVSAMPNTYQLLKEKKLLSTDQILQIMNQQCQGEVGFKEACQALGFWSSDLENQLKKELNTSRPPLTQILLKRGVVSLPDLTKALDEFLSDDQNLSIHN